MAVRHRRLGQQRARRQAGLIAEEVRFARARIRATLREVGRRAGVSPETVRRIELGDASVEMSTLCAVAEAVGVDVVVKGYPASGFLMRDSGQLTIARMVCAIAHPAWHTELEVPAGDHGQAIDIGFFGSSEIIATEIDRLLLDWQEPHRRNVRKRDYLSARHQRPVRLVMVTEDTPRNRRAVEPHMDLIRAVLPAGSREILGALRAGQPLGRDGLLWIRPSRPPVPASRRLVTVGHSTASGAA